MLEKFKQLVELQKQAISAKKELSKTQIEVASGNGLVKVAISGELTVKSVFIDAQLLSPAQKEKLESTLKDCFQKAITQAQQAALSKISSMTGGMNMAGLLER